MAVELTIWLNIRHFYGVAVFVPDVQRMAELEIYVIVEITRP